MRSISRRETLTSISLLAILPLVAAAVYWKGQHYEPDLFALDPVLLGGTPPAVVRFPEMAAGFEADGEPEVFEPSSLHEKVDGRAELYFEHGFETLHYAAYIGPEETRFIDIFAYEMAAPANASDIYRLEKPPDAVRAPLGEDGYRVEASYFFRRGRYYVQVVSSEGGRVLEDAALALARDVDEILGALP